LDLAELDIVYIATPNHRHKDDCLQAIAAGKAILCEKPLALNAVEAGTIAEAGRKAGLFCMEGMWTHFIPAVVEADRLLKNCSIGKPIRICGTARKKGRFRALRQVRTALPGALENTVDQTQLKTLQREIVRPIRNLESESQKRKSRADWNRQRR
jgi:Oxidoreductase family, NAD-binding Rossmann fold